MKKEINQVGFNRIIRHEMKKSIKNKNAMGLIRLQTRYLCYEISADGQNIGFSCTETGQNRVLPGPCAKIVNTDRTEVIAVRAKYDKNILTINFSDNTILELLVKEHENYITFTIQSISREDFLAVSFVNIQLDTESNDFYGSMLGMTLSTRMHEHPGDNRMLIASAYPHIGLYSTKRSPYPAKAAVIGAPKYALRDIEKLVLEEIPDGEIPKSSKGGPYADSVSEEAKGIYSLFIKTVNMDNIEKAIADMKRFNIKQVNLHHYGHYIQGDFRYIEDDFTNGKEEFKSVVDRFHEEGILVGLHTYAFFLSTKSTYVTPIPHPDLDTLREFTLAESFDETAVIVKVCESTYGVTSEEGYILVNSPYLWIDDELIKFTKVEDGSFDICQRGAYGTIPTAHKKGARVRQLKQYFFLPSARVGSELFYEIARNTARIYNESGADLFYLDALDGSFILDGEDYVWYHAMDFIREMFRFLERDPVFDCCYNPQYTGSWFVRSRYGAMDEPLNAHRQYFDAHVKYNVETAIRMGITPELGWVNLYPHVGESEKQWQNDPLYAEDLEYLCAKAFATNASLAFFENFREYGNLPCSEEYVEILQKYASFRHECSATDETRVYLSQSGNAAYLKEGVLYQAKNCYGILERSGDSFFVDNPFVGQRPTLRIEFLCAAGDYDDPKGVTLCEFSKEETLKNQSFRFDYPISSCGNRGLGVWCNGDGSGAIVCIKLRNLSANQQRSGEHFIRVNFDGWRYFAFYENQNGILPIEEWPRMDVTYRTYNELQKFYGHYRVKLNYDMIDGVDIVVKGSDNIFLKPIRLVPHIKTVWKKPTIILGNSLLTVLTDLYAESVLYFNGENCIVTDKNGNVLEKPQWIGTPFLNSGKNYISMVNDGEDSLVRAKITVNLLGSRLQ